MRQGTFYERTQQPDKAIAAYEAGYKVDPAQLKKALTQGLILSSKPEEKQRGRKLLDEMLSAPTADADVKMIQAQALLTKGRWNRV